MLFYSQFHSNFSKLTHFADQIAESNKSSSITLIKQLFNKLKTVAHLIIGYTKKPIF